MIINKYSPHYYYFIVCYLFEYQKNVYFVIKRIRFLYKTPIVFNF
jgi:hypothetical protein